jgi:hypothetical protein
MFGGAGREGKMSESILFLIVLKNRVDNEKGPSRQVNS